MASRVQVVPTLELICPSLPGRMVELKGNPFRIGRDPASDLFLDLRAVSWRHAWIRRLGEGSYESEDLDSYNSTYLDGARLTRFMPRPLRDGSRIRICDVVLIFRHQAVEVRETSPAETTILGSVDEQSALTRAALSPRAGAM